MAHNADLDGKTGLIRYPSYPFGCYSNPVIDAHRMGVLANFDDIAGLHGAFENLLANGASAIDAMRKRAASAAAEYVRDTQATLLRGLYEAIA